VQTQHPTTTADGRPKRNQLKRAIGPVTHFPHKRCQGGIAKAGDWVASKKEKSVPQQKKKQHGRGKRGDPGGAPASPPGPFRSHLKRRLGGDGLGLPPIKNLSGALGQRRAGKTKRVNGGGGHLVPKIGLPFSSLGGRGSCPIS